MLTAPRIHGTLLRSLARLARTRAGKAALERALRKELGIDALAALPLAMRGAIPLHNRVVAGRPPRHWQDAGLPPPDARAWPRTSADYVRAYTSRKTTPERVTANVLERAEALRASKTGPFSELRADEARTDADASGDRYRAGTPKGALDGVCVAIKEQIAVMGMPLRAGTSFLPMTPEPRDATVVRRLREAGAIVVGQTVMTEYGMTPLGFNPNRDMPKNPHDPSRTAGGSSTGSGVSVALGLTPIAIGADGGGSIRIPASACGVFGIKPTWGRVSRDGDVSGGTVAHVGPLAASSADLARVLEIIGAPDPLDPETGYAPPLPPGSLVRSLSRGVRTARIGVCESEWSDASPHVARAGKMAISALEREGAVVVPLELSLAKYAPAIGYLSISVEARAGLSKAWAEHADEMTPDLQITMSVLEQLGAVEYVDAQRLRSALRAELALALEKVDVLVLPTLSDVAPLATAAHMESGFLDPTALAGLCRFNFLGNLTGLPAASVPMGMHDGAPMGLQIVGDAFDEASVLAVAAHLERLELARAERPSAGFDGLAD